MAAETNPEVALRRPLRYWTVRAPVAEMLVVPVPPIASVLPERLVVEALPVEREPEESALVTVNAEKVGDEAVVKF